MKKIFLCSLFFILVLGFVPTSAANVPDEYQTYIDNINGSGFWWKEFYNSNVTWNGTSVTARIYPWNEQSWWVDPVYTIPLTRNDANNIGGVHCNKDILNIYITSSNNVFTFNQTFNFLNDSGGVRSQDTNSSFGHTSNYALVYKNDRMIKGTQGADYTIQYSKSGTLDEVLTYVQNHFRNVNLYVNGVCWSFVGGSYSIETEIELSCDIQAVDSSFNFFNGGYGVTWKQGQYNWTQTGPLENVTRTMVWTVSYPTVSYVQSLYNQSFIDSTPLDVVRNAFNTVFNEGTSIYDIPEQYRATTNFFINIDSPELGSSYHTSYDSTTQQWSLTQNEYSYSLVNGYQFNTGFFQQLYQLYGDADLFSIALCYITPVRVSMYAVDDTQGIIYNPLSIYWLDLKQSNGTVLEYRNFGSQTTVTDDNVTDDTTSNDSVTGDDSPFVNPTEEQLNTNYNNSIQNSYNHTVNNYYNYNDINTDLLDYYLSFRDGGTEQDVQDAFGYLNSTISSLSNVPVVLHNLFYNFFPLPVIRLMQALFIVFMVFMIIIIIKHLFR